MDGVVGFKKVIKKPVTNPFEACLQIAFCNLESERLGFKDILVDKIKKNPDTIQNRPFILVFFVNMVSSPRFIIIIYAISADTAPRETLNPALKPFDIERLTDSRPEGPKGMEAAKPVKKANSIAFSIIIMVFSF